MTLSRGNRKQQQFCPPVQEVVLKPTFFSLQREMEQPPSFFWPHPELKTFHLMAQGLIQQQTWDSQFGRGSLLHLLIDMEHGSLEDGGTQTFLQNLWIFSDLFSRSFSFFCLLSQPPNPSKSCVHARVWGLILLNKSRCSDHAPDLCLYI